MKKKFTLLLLILSVFVFLHIPLAEAAKYDPVLQRWTKTKLYKGEDQLTNLTIYATYYSAEFIEAMIEKESNDNLWTKQETDDFKYKFLQSLRLDEMIPVHIKFINNADTMYLGPFDIMVGLRIGNKYYKPADYDKRFNFKFQGEKEGLIYFHRYDEKTGKDLLKDVKQVTLELKPTISPTITRGQTTKFLWDIAKDTPEALYVGTTAARIETDRLIKRLEKLRKDKADEEAKLASINGEISTIQARLDELAKVQ